MISVADLQNDYVRVSRVELQMTGVNTKATKEESKVTEIPGMERKRVLAWIHSPLLLFSVNSSWPS
jgi:hypothetical protein